MSSTDTVHDPISTPCKQCGHRQFNEPIRGETATCRECSAFVAEATDEQVRLFYKRMEQQILMEEGYVAVA